MYHSKWIDNYLCGDWLHMSHDKYWFHVKIGKHLVIIYVYLWLQGVPYNHTNMSFILFHCNDLIHSVAT